MTMPPSLSSTKQNLLPISNFLLGFTTNRTLAEHVNTNAHETASAYGNLTYIALTDESSLGVHKIASRTKHPVVTPPNRAIGSCAGGDDEDDEEIPPPRVAWEAFYPKGSVNPSGNVPGGFGFYISGSKEFAAALAADGEREEPSEALMSYRMMLEEAWDWVKGGKLPGVYGGEGTLAYGCTGGRKDDRCKCFNVRLMWRSGGIGELYVYIPPTTNNTQRLLDVPPFSFENPTYGFSVGRGAFTIPVGRWMSVAIRVRLNCLGEEDGEIELWIDGTSVISITGLTLRTSGEGKIKGFHFQTFFGGHGTEWASSKDQRAWFGDLTGVVVR